MLATIVVAPAFCQLKRYFLSFLTGRLSSRKRKSALRAQEKVLLILIKYTVLKTTIGAT
jgi:hypothetical protein